MGTHKLSLVILIRNYEEVVNVTNHCRLKAYSHSLSCSVMTSRARALGSNWTKWSHRGGSPRWHCYLWQLE